MDRHKGRVETVRPVIEGSRLKVRLTVFEPNGQQHFAFLPRSILLGSLRDVPQGMLKTIDPMLNKLVRGREVRLWQYSERWYASFLPWRSVRFADS